VKQSRDFEDFYAANYGKITALVAAVTGDWHEADDIAQEAFARALARWPRVSGYELPEAWVRQVAMRLAIDSARRLRRTLRALPLLRTAEPAEAPEPGDSLAFTALGRVLSRIPLREREVLVLYYVADLPVEQIAHDRGIPVGTVKSRLAAGRRQPGRHPPGHRPPAPHRTDRVRLLRQAPVRLGPNARASRGSACLTCTRPSA
jgi:RNA polymerase sigma-70 factor, ECF subfamily